LRDSLLGELALREDVSREPYSIPDCATFERLKRPIDKARCEIMEALRTMFEAQN